MDAGLRYFKGRAADQLSLMQGLVAVVQAGELAAAESAHLASRPPYEGIEVLAASFAGTDSVIDARPYSLGELWAELQARKGAKPEKVERKRHEWGASKGVMILTCTSAPDADEVVQKEDYAACCCAAQNFTLHLWAAGLGSKWSTGAVWKHEGFWPLLGHVRAPAHTDVVGIFFYGVPERVPEGRRKRGLGEVVVKLQGGEKG